MNAAIRQAVQDRAGHRCEYCRIHEDDDPFAFHVEHVVAKQHGGDDDLDNLAWSCQDCNSKKGPNLSGRLRPTGEVVTLFHPRKHQWARHFRWQGAILEGRTKSGKATIHTLELNAKHRIALRLLLIAAGKFPPQ
jgi:hypothetical protein